MAERVKNDSKLKNAQQKLQNS